jgi:hypothetical protein
MLFIKKLLIILSGYLLLFSPLGCNNRDNTLNKQTQLGNPPALKILYQDKSIDAKRGTYSWTIDNNDGTKTTTNADSSAPPELVKDSTQLTVSPKSSLNLSFSDKPTDITINIWQDNKTIKQSIINDKVVTPELKGSVIYEVIGTWKQGTVSYAFLVNVD